MTWSPRRRRRDLTEMPRAGGVVAATIEVYNSISAELLPTPSKFHYTFNLARHLEGLPGPAHDLTSEVQRSRYVLSKLWLHESQRVL